MSSLASYFLYFSAVLKHNTFATVHVYNSFTVTDYLQQEANHKMSQIQNNRVRCKTHHNITRKTRGQLRRLRQASQSWTRTTSARRLYQLTVADCGSGDKTDADAASASHRCRTRVATRPIFEPPPTVFSTPSFFYEICLGGVDSNPPSSLTQAIRSKRDSITE